MGIQDRDYYYEKRDEQNPIRKDRIHAIKNSSKKSSFKAIARVIFIWFFIILIFFIIFYYYNPQLRSKLQAIQKPLTYESLAASFAIPRNCELLPSHGSSYVIEPSVMKRSDILYSGLEIENKHNFPIVVVLSDVSGSKRFLAVSVASYNFTQVSIPIGQYGMQVLTGSEWCNLNEGFSDGVNISITGGILIKAGETSFLSLKATGQQPEQFSVNSNVYRSFNYKILNQPAEVSSLKRLDLLQTREGHYFSSGTINQLPVVFMIDTGATNVSISSEVASRAGIKKCSPRLVSTANGNVNACSAIVTKITFGKFKLDNVEVTIMPNMSSDSLLGMNVLKNFRIEQVGNVMRISSQ
ncbi:retropepsin-like aspartic protease family protein [Nitrosomonas communis]|uniref:Clan AA aspartic protease, TIGR02281 family n=1 Tax=Nitrosomonas communis TaxID=44574 RepID=A0A1I4PR55_9PROT|nr:retropepsin-like aspartic protease [Nitrosomonas communis]SFM30381.1 clan AA aspartic protease, TIGR02281 family [Nitrosomonas communis]